MDRLKLVHPFIFAIIPILFLYVPNCNSTSPEVILRPCLVVSAFTLAALLGLAALLKDGQKAAIVVTLFWILFFAYGYLLTIVKAMDRAASDWRLFWHPSLPILLFVLFSMFSFKVVRSRHSKELANLMGFAGLCVLALQLIEVVQIKFTGAPEFLRNTPIQSAPGPLRRPNIFYIILDAYGRSDVLRELYHFDNGNFLDHLRQEGFYIASESHSNYSQTYLSLASSLNFSYLDDVARRAGESHETSVLSDFIQGSQLASFLRTQGYRFVSFSSGVSLTEIKNADVFVNCPRFLSQFEYVLLMTTPVGQFTQTSRFQESLHRERLSYIFKHLPDYASSRTPVFVFAHILAPHEPFVFGEAGQAVDDTGNGGMTGTGPGLDYAVKYRRQIQFVTKRIQRTIDEILAQSSEPPIIVLQSDHGPAQRPLGEFGNLQERMSILHASHLPDGCDALLYPRITPVNTFRIILRHYFHADLPLLGDKSFYSTYDHPFRFVDVTNRIR